MADSPRTPSDADGRGSKREKFLKLARDRFKQAEDADKEQRKRELDDLKFYAGDQWQQDVRDSRRGLQASGDLPSVPARPCITINKTREPVRTVLNQERGSDITIEIVPADDFGDLTGPIDETEITIREGLTRRIQRESQAADARTWAFARGTIAGRGYYGVMTRYAPGKSWDKEIYVHRFYNQASVLGDPAHEQPDGSDAEWWFVGTNVPWATYKAEHGERNGKTNRIAHLDDSEWRALGDEQPDWFITEGDLRSVRVVEYYYTDLKARTLCQMVDGTAAWKEELPKDLPNDAIVDERVVVEKTIKWCKIDGCDDDVLEETDWEGPDMPIVKVVGEELHPYDKERRVEGMVRPMRESGQGFNVMVSKLVEVVGLTPIDPPLIEEGTIEGYEEWWKSATTRTLPYLPFKMRNLDNEKASTPPFALSRNPPIAPIAAALQMFDDGLQSTSSVSDPAMGQTDSSVKSAKHAGLLREQAAQATSNYMDNLKRSMRYEGQIINNLLYNIYGKRPGRIARIINGQGEAETLLIGQPMVQQGGKPTPAAEGDPNAKNYQLTKDAKFNVGIKITSSKEFRREQEAQTVGELIAAAPTLLTVFGDLYFKNLDGPGHDEMAERMKVMLDPKVLQLLEAKKSGQDIPPEVQAKLAQADQEKQQLTQQLQQAAQMIQGKQVEAQAETARHAEKLKADIEQARIKADTDMQIEAMKQRTELTIAEWKLRGQQMQAELDAVQADRDRRFGADQQQGAQAHEAGMAQQGQQAEAQEAERSRVAQSEAQGAEQEHAAQMQAGQQAAAERQAAVAAQEQGGQ